MWKNMSILDICISKCQDVLLLYITCLWFNPGPPHNVDVCGSIPTPQCWCCHTTLMLLWESQSQGQENVFFIKYSKFLYLIFKQTILNTFLDFEFWIGSSCTCIMKVIDTQNHRRVQDTERQPALSNVCFTPSHRDHTWPF